MTIGVGAVIRQRLPELRNVAWLLGDKAVRMAIAITIGSWVARHLGPSSYGALAYAVALASFVQIGATLGSDSVVVRDLARRPESAGEILGTVLACRLATGACLWCGLLVLATMQIGGADRSWLLLLVVSLTAVFQAGDVVDLWFQSQAQNRRTVIPKAVGLVLSNSFRVALIVVGAPLVWYGVAFALDSFVGAISMGIAYRFLPAPGRLSVSLIRAKLVIRESAPYLAANILVTLYMRLDMLLLRRFSGVHAVGVFAAATALSTFPGFLPLLLNNVSAPLIARKKMFEAPTDYYRALSNLFRIYSGLGWLSALGLALIAPLAVPILYGPSFREAIAVLQILAVSNIFIFIGVAQILWFVNEGRGVSALIKAMLGVVASAACGLALIPRFGVFGAALTLVIVQFIASIAVTVLIDPGIFKMQLRAMVLLGQGRDADERL